MPSRLKFPQIYNLSKSLIVRNVNEMFDDQMTFGQRAADWVASFMGAWPFIIGQTIVLIIWVILNVTAVVNHWDPYPFILMNLVLSLQAAFTAPIIMMSQNRQSEKDRLDAHMDYLVNQRTEEAVQQIMEQLAAQNEALIAIHDMLNQLATQKSDQ